MKIDFVVLLLSLVVVFGVVEAKTTDELIEEAEKLLGSAPHVVAAPPAPAAAPAPKAAAAQHAPLARAMPVQQAKPAGGDMRFRNSGPFGGAEVNLAAPRQAPGAAFAPMMPGVQMQGMPMPNQQMPGMQMPGMQMPVAQQQQQFAQRPMGMPVQPPQGQPLPGPPTRPAWTPPAAGAATQSSVPVGGIPPPPAMLLETQSQNGLRGKRLEDGMNAAVFGYGRVAPGAQASYGAPAFGERSARYNPAPVSAARAPQGGYSKVNEIAKAEAWQRAHQSQAAAAARKPQAVAPPRFRQLFPQQANPINPFYQQHMAKSGEADAMALHNSIAELNKIPDASQIVDSNARSSSTDEGSNPRFAENIVKTLPDLAKAATGDTTKAALKQPVDDRVVSKPQYDNQKPAIEAKKRVEEKKVAKAAAPPAPAAGVHHKRHHHPVGLRRRASAIMRFNQIKLGHFKPSASRIVFHDWVGKSKARVADRIRRTLIRGN